MAIAATFVSRQALISGVPAGGRLAADTARRQRWSASLSSRTRHGSGHPEQSDPQATSSFRRDRLSPTQPHRAHVLPRLKDWRRIATRYDKLAANFAATVMLAALIIWWT
jgi:hypothetical protein